MASSARGVKRSAGSRALASSKARICLTPLAEGHPQQWQVSSASFLPDKSRQLKAHVALPLENFSTVPGAEIADR